ncbi:hypothetical protein BUY94_05915 [Mammaliicoccus fleurettii]|uniref:hypothetical protein n=1 Tax=Mammaliicoccus TaxID=2803850 RepID=UPI000D1C7C27|nr:MULTISPECIES: hypothetical protein [Mammaliicoccus]PTE33846.1 hypothetical protein BUY94_05915 [Mammaliicoccus fleurettii]PTK07949.1 hypothetical protein BUZ89_03670 [Mammaliicoccus sciuri]
MNIQVINQLLSDENVVGVQISLTENISVSVSDFDKKLSSANILYVTKPSMKVVNLEYAVKLEPISDIYI